MQKASIFDQPLIFGEHHDDIEPCSFLTQHLLQFYQRGYRILVIEVGGGLPIGHEIDEHFLPNTPLQVVLDSAYEMVAARDDRAQTLLTQIEEGIKPVLGIHTHKDAFGSLVKTALEKGFRVLCLDPANDPTYDAQRVKSYDTFVAAALPTLKEKWLCLVGDAHMNGLVRRLGGIVIGFHYDVLRSAIQNATLQNIDDLANLQTVLVLTDNDADDLLANLNALGQTSSEEGDSSSED